MVAPVPRFASIDYSKHPAPKEAYGWRIYLLAVAASCGSGMFGFDVGFIGSTLALPAFKTRFGLNSAASTALSANIVSTFLAGCFFGALFVAPVLNKWGRKIALLAAAIVFLIGSIMATASTGQIGLIYAGRALTGLGVGPASLIVPVYISECSPPAIRGRLIGIFESFLQIFQVIGFWMAFGANRHIGPTNDAQWRLPFGFQIVPAVLTIGLMLTQPESPRFLVRTGKTDEARRVLSRIRNIPITHDYIEYEIKEIEDQLQHEHELTKGSDTLSAKFALIRQPANLRRLIMGMMLMTLLGISGINSINYFSPTVIRGLGFTGTSATLLASGIYGLVKCAANVIFLWFLVDKAGRRVPLLIGSAGASFALFYIAIYAARSGSFNGLPAPDAGGYVALVMIYVFAVFLSVSWTGLPWLICAEIFPSEIREICTTITTLTQWLVQFAIVYATPYMMRNLTWGAFVFFGCCVVTSFGYVWYFVPETRGISLENMDILFSQSGSARQMRSKTLAILAEQRENEGASSEADEKKSAPSV